MIKNSTSPTGLKLKSHSQSELYIRTGTDSVEALSDSTGSGLSHSHSSDNVVKLGHDLNDNEENSHEVSEESKVLRNLDFVLNNEFNIESVTQNVETLFTEIPLNESSDKKDSCLDSNGNPIAEEQPSGGPTFKLRLASTLRNKRLQAVAVSLLLNSIPEINIQLNCLSISGSNKCVKWRAGDSTTGTPSVISKTWSQKRRRTSL